jgi:maltose O-acetyltransferase
MKYMIVNLILALLPPTRFFSLKRFLLRRLGIQVGVGTNVCGAVKIYGGGKVAIGKDCWIGIGTKFYTSTNYTIAIGDRCDIAPDVCFISGTHEIGSVERRAGTGYSDHITVGSGTWIGARSTVNGGCVIGEAAIVGSGALLLGKTYPGSNIFAGVPARILKELP